MVIPKTDGVVLIADGNCAFEVSIHKRDQRTAPAPEFVTIGMMDAAARSLNQVCVNGHPASGGVVRGLGKLLGVVRDLLISGV